MNQVSVDLSQTEFPCANCGALQQYAPGTELLRCPYCEYETPIKSSDSPIVEHDFSEALRQLNRETPEPQDSVRSVKCNACAASFEFEEDIHAGECPYCGTPLVLGTEHKTFRPQSLLPFHIDQSKAKDGFKKWLKGLWFAPGDLKKYADDDTPLRGVYVPYWTYDSQTYTEYAGERGDYYQVPKRVTVVVKGRRVTRTQMVTKVRWTRVRGRVSRFFDDVLVGANESLPRKITDKLEPWDLDQLVPYQEQYLSGFSSQIYQVQLDAGFSRANEIMERIIRQDIRRDIGGNLQRIHHQQTRHQNTTFKHILLPIWSAGFRYRGKEYLFVVNGRTGKVQGERPVSKWKVFFAFLVAIIVFVGLYFINEYSG